jgi:hypothetical protein
MLLYSKIRKRFINVTKKEKERVEEIISQFSKWLGKSWPSRHSVDSLQDS